MGTLPVAWNFAVPDWEQRIVHGQSLMPTLPLDQVAAKRAVGVFNKLHIPDVVGEPSLAEAAGEWFREIVAALFGSIDPETGERRVGEVFCLAPKKSSKTTNSAALMLTALLLNVRPRAEFLLVAPTHLIAEQAYSQAFGMIYADPSKFLERRLRPREHLKMIVDLKTKATLRIKTFDTKVLTGVKPVGVLIDELHEISSMAEASRVIGQVRGGLLPNPEGFLFFITTQSDKPPVGVFKAELHKARAIRDGQIKGNMLPILYEFPDSYLLGQELDNSDAPWREPKNWWMVTPNLGLSVTLPKLESSYQTALNTSQEEIIRWASQHLNIEVGLAIRSSRWVGAEWWLKRADDTLTLDELLRRSEVVAVGLDGGGLDDLLGLAVIGRVPGVKGSTNPTWLLWNHAWAHESVLERRKSEVSRLQDFAAQNDLTIVSELGTDFDEVGDICEKCERSYKLAKIGLDPVGSVGSIMDVLMQKNIPAEKVLGVAQGYRLTGAIKTFERKLVDGTLMHAGQPLMTYAVENAKVEAKGNGILITKQAAGTAKIDPLVASLNAGYLMQMNPAAPPKPTIAWLA